MSRPSFVPEGTTPEEARRQLEEKLAEDREFLRQLEEEK